MMYCTEQARPPVPPVDVGVGVKVGVETGVEVGLGVGEAAPAGLISRW